MCVQTVGAILLQLSTPVHIRRLLGVKIRSKDDEERGMKDEEGRVDQECEGRDSEEECTSTLKGKQRAAGELVSSKPKPTKAFARRKRKSKLFQRSTTKKQVIYSFHRDNRVVNV
tara:strand:- start:200 stop:544 length:345 start_codon:yes stop_codon:yes gene_type:complete